MQRTLIVALALAMSSAALAADPVRAASSGADPSANPSTTMIVPVGNATVSATPSRVTTTTPAAATGASEADKPAAPSRRALSFKGRLDDGRYSGFHQAGGDQPAGDQQFRPAERVQAESKRLSRESGERKSPPPEAASTPAMRDQSSIVRTQ